MLLLKYVPFFVILYFRLNIDKDDARKMFVIDFGLQIEIGGNSIIDNYLLENQDVPIPICNENFTLPGTLCKNLFYPLANEVAKRFSNGTVCPSVRPSVTSL